MPIRWVKLGFNILFKYCHSPDRQDWSNGWQMSIMYEIGDIHSLAAPLCEELLDNCSWQLQVTTLGSHSLSRCFSWWMWISCSEPLLHFLVLHLGHDSRCSLWMVFLAFVEFFQILAINEVSAKVRAKIFNITLLGLILLRRGQLWRLFYLAWSQHVAFG